MREFGDDEKDWIGRFVTIGSGRVKNQYGEPVDALMVRPADAVKPRPKTSKARPSSADMNAHTDANPDDEIPF